MHLTRWKVDTGSPIDQNNVAQGLADSPDSALPRRHPGLSPQGGLCIIRVGSSGGRGRVGGRGE